MPYATVADLVARFGEAEIVQLTDPLEQAAVNAAKAQRALDDAQAFVDGFVGRVYQLPLTGCAKPQPGGPVLVPPPQLTRIVCDVARFYLHDEVPEDSPVVFRFKTARGELQAIAEGKAALQCPWGGEPGLAVGLTPAGAGETRYEFTPRAVGDDVAGSYR